MRKYAASGCLAAEVVCPALISASSYHGVQADVLTIGDKLTRSLRNRALTMQVSRTRRGRSQNHSHGSGYRFYLVGMKSRLSADHSEYIVDD